MRKLFFLIGILCLSNYPIFAQKLSIEESKKYFDYGNKILLMTIKYPDKSDNILSAELYYKISNNNFKKVHVFDLFSPSSYLVNPPATPKIENTNIPELTGEYYIKNNIGNIYLYDKYIQRNLPTGIDKFQIPFYLNSKWSTKGRHNPIEVTHYEVVSMNITLDLPIGKIANCIKIKERSYLTAESEGWWISYVYLAPHLGIIKIESKSETYPNEADYQSFPEILEVKYYDEISPTTENIKALIKKIQEEAKLKYEKK